MEFSLIIPYIAPANGHMGGMISEKMTPKTKSRFFSGRECDGMAQKLEDAAAMNRAVSSLTIRDTALEEDAIDSIVDLLSKGSVKTIHLGDCSAQLDNSAHRLVEALGNCRDVRLSERTFLSKFYLDAFLGSATQLKNLRIRDHLLVEQVEALSRGLASNKILHTLDLSRSRIDCISILADGLKGGCAKELKLRSIGLRDSQLFTLMEALETSPSCAKSPSSPNTAAATALESLDLSFNRLRNLKCIGDFLKQDNCNLKELLIGYQNLWMPSSSGTHIDVSEIANALFLNKKLTTLKLTRNELNDSDAILFAVALSENRTLETLDLRENNIADDGVIALAEAAQFSRGLKQLQLRGNPFGARASLALLEAAQNNFNLFFIGDNGRGDSDVINKQIRYHTALNRGGRKLLLDVTTPFGLWPLVLEKQASLLEQEEADEGSDATMGTDVIFYLLKQSPATFFSTGETKKPSIQPLDENGLPPLSFHTQTSKLKYFDKDAYMKILNDRKEAENDLSDVASFAEHDITTLPQTQDFVSVDSFGPSIPREIMLCRQESEMSLLGVDSKAEFEVGNNKTKTHNLTNAGDLAIQKAMKYLNNTPECLTPIRQARKAKVSREIKRFAMAPLYEEE